MSDVFSFTLRFPIAFALLACGFAADLYRQTALSPRLAPVRGRENAAQAALSRRLAYYGALSLLLVAFGALAMARLGRF